jgi:hypothetical protein
MARGAAQSRSRPWPHQPRPRPVWVVPLRSCPTTVRVAVASDGDREPKRHGFSTATNSDEAALERIPGTISTSGAWW